MALVFAVAPASFRRIVSKPGDTIFSPLRVYGLIGLLILRVAKTRRTRVEGHDTCSVVIERGREREKLSIPWAQIITAALITGAVFAVGWSLISNEAARERVEPSPGKIVIGPSKIGVQESIYRNWGHFYGKSLTLYRDYYCI